MHNPTADRIRAEVSQIFGDGYIIYSDIEKLVFMLAVSTGEATRLKAVFFHYGDEIT